MSATRRLGALVALLLLVASSPAADIAGNDGWLPLSEAVARYDIDPAFVDQALDAGGELSCWRDTDDGHKQYNSLNAWFVAGDMGHIITNGHFFYDMKGVKRTGFDNCYVATNRDVLASPDSSAYRKLMIDPDITHSMFGGPDPAGLVTSPDRALIPLTEGSADGVVAFEEHPELFDEIQVGSTVFMLSTSRFLYMRNRKGGHEPMLQKCTVLQLDLATADTVEKLTQIITDCDTQHGVSASRVFVPTSGSPTQLLAIGLLMRGSEYGGTEVDGLPPDPVFNSSTAVMTDRDFYEFPCTGADLVDVAIQASATC